MKLAMLMILSSFWVPSSFANPHFLNGPWKGDSNPKIMSRNFNYNFNELPLTGSIEDGKRAWSGHYWPSQKAGINHRWRSPYNEMFNYPSPTKDEVKKMSLDERAILSPAEKFDLLLGRYEYPLKNKVASSVKKYAPEWAGLCHGWAVASLHHAEPTPKVATNPDGIQIPFGSDDIKAILSYYYAKHYDADRTHQMGKRCNPRKWFGGSTKNCEEDLNAGAFHIVMANRLGLEKLGFIADVDRFEEVWNQPIAKYQSKILKDNLPPSVSAAKSAVKEIKVSTDLYYVDESEPQWAPVLGTEHQLLTKLYLVYYLEISAQGKIVGGRWESTARPDFLWYKERTESFDGPFQKLTSLLND